MSNNNNVKCKHLYFERFLFKIVIQREIISGKTILKIFLIEHYQEFFPKMIQAPHKSVITKIFLEPTVSGGSGCTSIMDLPMILAIYFNVQYHLLLPLIGVLL